MRIAQIPDGQAAYKITFFLEFMICFKGQNISKGNYHVLIQNK